MISRTSLAIAFLSTSLASSLGCQQNEVRLTAEQRQVVIDSITNSLNRMYVFPEVATRMDTDLRTRVKSGEFDTATAASSFAQLLTQDLQAISHDKHLRVRMRSANPSSGPAGSFGLNSSIFVFDRQ